MPISVKMLNDQIKYISKTNTLLDMLLRFEKVLDEVDLYAFQNWVKGEILQGPKLDRHYITVKLMYPVSRMPDPAGAQRLFNIDCLVKFQKEMLEKPVPAQKFTDRVVTDRYDDGTLPRRYELEHEEVWVVTVKMPRRYVDEFANIDRTIDPTEQEGETAAVKDAQQAAAPMPGMMPGMMPGLGGI